MIPKIIHYCWFGRNPKPQLILNCIESWKRFCPDYEIIEWNEDNFNINECKFCREAYEAKNWAFVSDYARLFVLEKFGGIYLDTDLELLKPLDTFLNNDGFLGFESRDYVGTSIMGSGGGHQLLKELKADYEISDYYNSDGTPDLTTNVRRMRKTLLEGGLINNGKQQTVCGMTIYPQKYFFPYNIGLLFNHKPKKSYAIHYVTGSWGNGVDFHGGKLRYLKLVVVNRLRSLIGTDTVDRIKRRLNRGN